MLIDVPGLLVGHTSAGDTGVTAVVSADPAGMVAGVDVRGGGPGTRETDLLAPHNTVERVHAIVLSGGSAFGLAAADGAMAELERARRGFPVLGEGRPGPRVPIVPAAVIFDLLLGERTTPDADLGRAALDAALGADREPGGEPGVESGCVGAGTGAMAGALKGGVGQASVRLPGGRTVAAIVVANPLGAVVDPEGRPWGDPAKGRLSADAISALSRRFIGLTKVPVPGASESESGAAPPAAPPATLNTTIGCIVTDAPLTQDQAKRLAMSGHDGMARAIRPSHLPMDGDTLFCLAATGDTGDTGDTGEDGAGGVPPEELAMLAAAAADAVQHAIVDAVISATGRGGVASFAELTADAD